jgi:hypothetical protein
MKKLSAILVAALLSLSSVQASNCHTDAKHTQKHDSKLLADAHKVDGYSVKLTSKKPLVVGNNDIEIQLLKDGEVDKEAKVKIKFFMPEMPGMPYMEYKEKLKLEGDVYKGVVNFSMGGTWQYHLKFKKADGSIHKIRGSINL